MVLTNAVSRPPPPATARQGITALHLAAENGHTGTVEALLSGKANPNMASKELWTPLHYACNMGYADMAKALLAAGGPRHASSWTSFVHGSWALPCHGPAALEISDVCDGPVLSCPPASPATPAWLAECHVASALPQAPSPTAPRSRGARRWCVRGATPGLRQCHARCVFAAPEGLASQLARLGFQRAPLEGGGWVLSKGRGAAGRTLPKLAPQSCRPGAPHTRCAQHMATRGGNYDIVVALLGAKAKPGPADKPSSTTPLHLAADLGHTEIAEALLGAGGQPGCWGSCRFACLAAVLVERCAV